MTKDEAKLAIAMGFKVTHRFFDSDEFITIASDGSKRYEDENGYLMNPALFWADRKGDAWNKDWDYFSVSIIKM